MLHYENMLYTGDDDGTVKIWDIRQKKATKTFSENCDFISDLGWHENMLLCTSGDGTLAVYDLRKNILEAMSDNMEDELLSISIVKNGSKVVCGSQSGVLNIFSWGDWGDVSDRFPGHPESIDTLIAVNEDVLLTGSSDGLIRVVSILPNKLLGVIGEHENFPVERLAISRDLNMLGSCSHDNTVKFWNIAFFWEEGEPEGDAEMDTENRGNDEDDDDDDDDEGDEEPIEEEEEQKEKVNTKKLAKTKESAESRDMKDFFSDL
eukprot:TRINITY_DN266_c1_g1_i1.p1 TRINITY_DN266_c1_g1~~TRINITY_DN266_c1_g1_i1.p1  ORF type:complete len:263 (+),score=83.80 TRINITY_DN266_c1_g1_i1:339-1127(+)